ncbi:hypothetical protein TrVGV298_001033 [Trichoderma virens]|nr:hypothetical protein TrVGV298_001033 [Trichoderma virens]
MDFDFDEVVRIYAALRAQAKSPQPPDPNKEVRICCLEGWCRACGEDLSGGEMCVFVSEVAPGRITVRGPSDYPTDDMMPSTRGNMRRLSNWDPFGLDDEPNQESATLHSECYRIFRRNCPDADALRRLLLAAIWRSPWKWAPKFGLNTNTDAASLAQLAATACHLPQLVSMPTELKRMVGQELLTQPSVLIRYHSTMSLAADSSRRPYDEQASMSISKAASWERGQGPSGEIEDLPPIIRITIDCQGVKRIERFAQRPEWDFRQSDTELYIMESQEALANVQVQFQSGLARLNYLGDGEATCLLPWDTPTPPAQEDLLAVRGRSANSSKVVRFSTIDVSKITGITFFLNYKIRFLLAQANRPNFWIHAHTPKAPSAISTFEYLYHTNRSGIMYYVPFPSSDRLTFFGVRNVRFPAYFQVLLRFEKAGDYVVGFESPQFPDCDDTVWPADDQLQFICGQTLSGKTDAAQSAFMSMAPLEHVVGIRLFAEVDSIISQGLLLEYENGAQRSLGECRVGIDTERAYANPVGFCIGRQPGDHCWMMEVRVDGQTEHKHGEGVWTCHEMRGNLICVIMREHSELYTDDADPGWNHPLAV